MLVVMSRDGIAVLKYTQATDSHKFDTETGAGHLPNAGGTMLGLVVIMYHVVTVQ